MTTSLGTSTTSRITRYHCTAALVSGSHASCSTSWGPMTYTIPLSTPSMRKQSTKHRECWSCGSKFDSRKFRRCETCRAKPYIYKMLICGNDECPDGEWEWNPSTLQNIDRPPTYCPECRELFQLGGLALAREVHSENRAAVKTLCKRCEKETEHERVYCDSCWDTIRPSTLVHNRPLSDYQLGPKSVSSRPNFHLKK